MSWREWQRGLELRRRKSREKTGYIIREVKKVQTQTKRSKLRWFDHVMRMEKKTTKEERKDLRAKWRGESPEEWDVWIKLGERKIRLECKRTEDGWRDVGGDADVLSRLSVHENC